jgi:hypothetical protein
MNQVSVKGSRIGGMALLVAVFIGGACCESVAQVVEHGSTQSRGTASRAQGPAAAPLASSDQQARLGPMRYYGGPKSPMWRGPAN